jgi:transposase
MDVHKDSISVGILNPGHERPDVERIFNDKESVRPLVARFEDPDLLRTCYEVGPTGYDLTRLLMSHGVHCQVITPSMIPKAPDYEVKTDERDCTILASSSRSVFQLSSKRPFMTLNGLTAPHGPTSA